MAGSTVHGHPLNASLNANFFVVWSDSGEPFCHYPGNISIVPAFMNFMMNTYSPS